MCGLNSTRLIAAQTGQSLHEVGTTTARPPWTSVPMGVLAGRPFEPAKRSAIHGRQRDVLKQIAPHLAIVYLSDRRQKPSIEQERCPLGFGRLQLGDVIWTLQEAGYTGDYDVKLLGSEIEEYDYWTLLEQSQLTFDELAPVASQRPLA